MANIILAEDELVTAILFKKKLARMNHNVIAIAQSAAEVIELSREHQPDFILMDINLKQKTAGIEACKKIKSQNKNIKIIFLSSYEEYMFETELKECHYDGYIDKYLFEFKIHEYIK